jgi:single-strand DNA-binding protein
MASFNKVILMGNLTRDVELKYTPSGFAVARLGLAVNRKWRDSKTNALMEEVVYVEIQALGTQAETAAKYLAKGSSVHIEGRLKLDQWDDKQTGQKRSKLYVVGERFQFVGAKPAAAQGAAARAQAPVNNSAPAVPSAPAAPAADEDPEIIQEQDIPF